MAPSPVAATPVTFTVGSACTRDLKTSCGVTLMTLPSERTRAVLWTRQFLQELLDPSKSPGVPRTVREQARMLLRHYPSASDMALAGQAIPAWFSVPTERKFREPSEPDE